MTDLWIMEWQRELRQEERQRLTDWLPEQRKKRFAGDGALCAYGLLRFALGGEAAEVTYKENGKPQLPQGHMSLSHTKGAALVGLSDAPIGVDIEQNRPLPPRLLRRLGEEGLRRWVSLEAQAKVEGEGIGVYIHRLGETALWAREVDAGASCTAAVACQGDFRLHRCTLEEILGEDF